MVLILTSRLRDYTQTKKKKYTWKLDEEKRVFRKIIQQGMLADIDLAYIWIFVPNVDRASIVLDISFEILVRDYRL